MREARPKKKGVPFQGRPFRICSEVPCGLKFRVPPVFDSERRRTDFKQNSLHRTVNRPGYFFLAFFLDFFDAFLELFFAMALILSWQPQRFDSSNFNDTLKTKSTKIRASCIFSIGIARAFA